MFETKAMRRVAWGDTDAAGVVYFANFFRYFDQATHELFRRIDYPLTALGDEGYLLPVVECHARFLSSLRYDEEIEIRSSVREVRSRALHVDHEIIRGVVVACQGYEVRVCVRSQPQNAGMNATELPTKLRALLLPASATNQTGTR